MLDEHGYFYGILTHTRLLDMLSQSWNVNVGSYVLTVVSVGERGDLAAMAKIITKYTSIAGCLTLDVQNGTLGYRTLFTLPENVDSEKLKRIIDNFANNLKSSKWKIYKLNNISCPEVTLGLFLMR